MSDQVLVFYGDTEVNVKTDVSVNCWVFTVNFWRHLQLSYSRVLHMEMPSILSRLVGLFWKNVKLFIEYLKKKNNT